MAIYGINFYGSSTYGYLPPTQFKSPLIAIPEGYGGVLLSWDTPGGSWDKIYLVRSSYEYVNAPGDGTLLVTGDAGTAPTQFHDVDLEPGRFYYYTLLVRTTEATPRFTQAGVAIVLATYDYNYRGQLWEFLPGLYHERDEALATPVSGTGPLYRYLSLIGYQNDVLRSEIETLQWTYSPDLISGGLLPLLAQQFDLVFEPEVGMSALRRVLKNAVHLYKNKGNETGIEGLVSAISNYAAEITLGKNLMLSQAVSNFGEGKGTWTVLTGTGAIGWNGVGTPVGFDGNNGVGVFSMSAGTNVFRSGADFFEAVPISVNTDYVVSVYARGDVNARNVDVRLTWLRKDGVIISSTAYGTAVATTTTDWTTRAFQTATSPSNARYCLVDVRFVGATADEEQFIDGVQLELGTTPTTYESPRDINIQLSPTRKNLCTNPSFEVDVSNWIATNTTLTRSTAVSLYGVASCRMQKSGAGPPVRMVWPDVGLSALAIDDATSRYSFSCYINPANPCSIKLIMRSYDGTGTLIDFTANAPVSAPVGAWTRISLVALPEEGAEYLSFGINEDSGMSIGDAIRVDGVLIEKAEALGDFFSGSVGAPVEDFLWAGTAQLSASLYYPRRTAKHGRMMEVLPRNIPINSTFELHYLPS